MLKKRILLTWVGRHNLDAESLGQIGPVGAVLLESEFPFDEVRLLANDWFDEAERYQVWLEKLLTKRNRKAHITLRKAKLESPIHYPKAGNGPRPCPLETILRVNCKQQWCNLSDPVMEEELCEIASMRLFAGLIHSLTTKATNKHDLNQTHNLIRREEECVFGDAGYYGAEKRLALKLQDRDWHVAQPQGTVEGMRKHRRTNKASLTTDYLKTRIRTKVEYPFRIIKCYFGFTKALYRGEIKNHSKFTMLFALVNVVRMDQMLRS